MSRALAGVCVGLVAVTGCAKASTGKISAQAARELRPFVADLRGAASGTDVATVTAKEQALVREVESLISNGDLSNSKGVKIENAAAALLNDFKKKYAPTPSPTPTEVSPTPSETPTTPTPGPTITITVPPTDTGSAGPTETATTKGHGNGNGNSQGRGHFGWGG